MASNSPVIFGSFFALISDRCVLFPFFSGFVDRFFLAIVGKPNFAFISFLYPLFCSLSRCTTPPPFTLISPIVVIECLITILSIKEAETLDCVVVVVFYFQMIDHTIILPPGKMVLALMPMRMIISSLIILVPLGMVVLASMPMWMVVLALMPTMWMIVCSIILPLGKVALTFMVPMKMIVSSSIILVPLGEVILASMPMRMSISSSIILVLVSRFTRR
jgi:hypothetical protein